MNKLITTILLLVSILYYANATENNYKGKQVNIPVENAQGKEINNYKQKLNFNYRNIIIPSTLIITGTIPLLWETNNLKISNNIANEMQDWSHGHQIKADTYLRHLPALSNIGLANLGASSKYDFKERFLTTATSYIIVSGVVKSLKICIKRERPDFSDYDSFPSGHTAIAFMGAELIRQSYDNPIYGIAAYGVASSVAFCRLYNNKHWVNDVIAGAGFGILSAQLSFLLLPLEKRIFKIEDKKKRSNGHSRNTTIAFAPYYEHNTNSMGFGLVALF